MNSIKLNIVLGVQWIDWWNKTKWFCYVIFAQTYIANTMSMWIIIDLTYNLMLIHQLVHQASTTNKEFLFLSYCMRLLMFVKISVMVEQILLLIPRWWLLYKLLYAWSDEASVGGQLPCTYDRVKNYFVKILLYQLNIFNQFI